MGVNPVGAIFCNYASFNGVLKELRNLVMRVESIMA